MPAQQQGEWVLLSQALPDSYALKLLGRVVATCTNPHHNYVPPSAAVIPTPAEIQVEDESASLCFDATRKTEVRARLTTLFHAEGTNTATSSHIIANTTIVTRLLDQHNTHFKGLKKLYGPDIEKLIGDKHRGKNEDARTAYLVVGTKTCINATMGSFDTNEATRSGGFQVPLHDIVTATVGMPPALPIPSQPDGSLSGKPLDITVDANDQRSVNTFRSGTAKGEMLFAIQCIRIRTHKSWKFWSKPELESHGIQDGVLGGSDSDADSLDSDDEAVESAPVTMAHDSIVAEDGDLELEPGSDSRNKGVSFVVLE